MMHSSLLELDREERMLLMRFVCSFAWVDLKVTVEERALAAHLISRLELDEDEMIEVAIKSTEAAVGLEKTEAMVA